MREELERRDLREIEAETREVWKKEWKSLSFEENPSGKILEKKKKKEIVFINNNNFDNIFY